MNDPRRTVTLDSVVVEAFPVNDERALRNEVEPLEMDWADQPDESRAAMVSLVRGALQRMADDVEEWLPSAVVAVSDESFGFFVWWKNRHLDEEVIRQRVTAEHDAHERLLDLQRMAGRADEDCQP